MTDSDCGSTTDLTAEQLAAELQVSTQTLINWRSSNQGPDFYRTAENGAVRYPRAWVDEWKANNRRGTRPGGR